MAQADYNLRVSYAPISRAPRRRARLAQPRSMALPQHVSEPAARPEGGAIRGLLLAVPLSALLWAPIVWEVSKLI